MYTWRCFIAVVFALVWYFSAFGQLWAQAFFCFLCFFNFFFKNHERDTGTQTDDLTEETTRQVTLMLIRFLFEKSVMSVVYQQS